MSRQHRGLQCACCRHHICRSAGAEQGPAALLPLSRVPLQQPTESPGLKSLAVVHEQPPRSGGGDPFRNMGSLEQPYDSLTLDTSLHGQDPAGTALCPVWDCRVVAPAQ